MHHLLLAPVILASTQPAEPPEASADVESVVFEQTQPPPVSFRLNIDYRTMFSADFQDIDGDVSVHRIRGTLGARFQLDTQNTLALSIGEEISFYDFDDSDLGLDLDSDDIFEDVYQTSLGASFFHTIDETWTAVVLGRARFAGEADADIGDAATFALLGGVRQKISDTLSLSYGLGFRTRLEDSTILVPLVDIRWQINDQVRLQGNRFGLALVTEIDEDWAISINGSWEPREYRLDEHRGSRLDEGVVQDDRAVIGLELIYEPSRTLKFSIEAGAILYQEFEFQDNDGDKLRDIDADPPPFIGGHFEWRF